MICDFTGSPCMGSECKHYAGDKYTCFWGEGEYVELLERLEYGLKVSPWDMLVKLEGGGGHAKGEN